MAKKIQTDYTRGGKAISDTAIPYYQNTLTTINDYIQNPYNTVDTILDKYYSNDVNQSDFLRNYSRAMANTTANNFAATGGGYSSSGQRAYNDAQRYQNDLAARLRSQGVQNAANMQNTWYNQALAGAGAFGNAYGLGKDYSDIEQYNNIANQNNSFGNQVAGIGGKIMQGVGGALTLVPGVGTAVGAGLMAAGKGIESMQIDPSSALGSGSTSNISSGQSGWTQDFSKGISNSILTNKEAGYSWTGRPLSNPDNNLWTIEQKQRWGVSG